MRKPLFLLAWVVSASFISTSLMAAPVEISAPPNGTTINGDGVEISIAMNSTDKLPVSRVEVSLDGKLVTNRTYAPPVSGGNSVFKWDTTRTPNGRHTLSVSAFSGGNVVGNATCEVIVSNTTSSSETKAPRVSIKSPRDGQVVSGTTSIVVESTDDSGTDPFVSIYVDKAIRSAGNVRPYSYNWDTRNTDNGPHYISARADNDASISAETPTIRVIVRNSVVKVPVSVQSTNNLPMLPQLLPSSTATSSVSAATTPVTSPNLNVTEAARSDANSTSESFEVNQLPVKKTASVNTEQLAALPSVPSAQLPTPTVSTPVQTPAQVKVEKPQTSTALTARVAVSAPAKAADVKSVPAAPKSVASVPANSAPQTADKPVLVVNMAKTESTTVAKSNTVLATPALPKPAEVLPNGLLSTPAETPSLAAKLESSNAATVAKTTTVLAIPAVPAPAVPAPSSAASQLAETPVLASATPSQTATSAKAENSLMTPAQPKPAAVQTPTVEGSKVASSPLSQPVLMAKADADDKASTVAKKNVLSTPAAPKPVIAAPKSDTKATVLPAVIKQTIKTHPAVAPAKPAVKTVAKPAAAKPAARKSVKMVRIRPVIENAGGTIQWDRTSKTVHAVAKQKNVTIKIGSAEAKVDNRKVKMDRRAAVKKSRTVVPESFVNDTFGETK